jgi:L-lactate dehydrogenase
MKISIVGVGRVGSAVAFALVAEGLAEQLVLVSRTRASAEAEARDLTHASAFTTERAAIRAGELADTAGSDVVVLCASVPAHAGIASRDELAAGNARLFDQIVPPLAEASPEAVLLVATNPVDAMTYHALRLSGFPPGRVIGTGTLVDSARFRTLIAEELGMNPDDVRAYILGEHGASQFPALSMSMTAGLPFERGELAERMFRRTVEAGNEIMRAKGYTNYAVALAATLVIDSIAHDARRAMPVSTLIDGYRGARDVCLSVPAIIGRGGVLWRLEPPLTEEETAAFQRSAEAVRKTIEAMNAP